jgi:hypothetical protein
VAIATYLETCKSYESIEEILASIREDVFVLHMPQGPRWADWKTLRRQHWPGSLGVFEGGAGWPRFYRVVFPEGEFRVYVKDPALRG